MSAILFRMPAGIPGAVTRVSDTTLEPGIVGDAAIPFGAPVKITAGKFAPLAEGDETEVIYGFMARRYPTLSVGDDYGAGSAAPGTQQDVMRRGYMAVTLKTGAAAKAGVVYVRTAADAGKAIGDIEAAAGAGLVAAPATFIGEADASGITEIAFNI